MVKVFFSKNNQVEVTISTAMQLSHGCKVEFIFNGKTWEIKKVEEKKRG